MKSIPRYIPDYVDFAPKDYRNPDLWQLEQPFAQITSDGYIIICRPWKRTDGASIPWWLWGVLGHHFKKGNAFWSQPHDQIYNDTAVILKLADFPDVARESMLLPCGQGVYAYDAFATESVTMPRKWADWAMVEAMGLTDEPRAKKVVAWAGVRTGGSKPWREARKAA